MEHLKAPRENLQTWDRVIKLFTYSGIACVITLGLMAVFLL
jgi:hypothetical protein